MPAEETKDASRAVSPRMKWLTSTAMKAFAIILPAAISGIVAWGQARSESRSDLASGYQEIVKHVEELNAAIKSLDDQIDKLNIVVAYQQGQRGVSLEAGAGEVPPPGRTPGGPAVGRGPTPGTGPRPAAGSAPTEAKVVEAMQAIASREERRASLVPRASVRPLVEVLGARK